MPEPPVNPSLSPSCGWCRKSGLQQFLIWGNEWDGRYFKWKAQSVVSNLFFRGGNRAIELGHGKSAQEECERLLKVITSSIPRARITKYTELDENVLSGLKKRGYSKTSPECELRFIEQSESVCRYGVFLFEGSVREPIETFSIEVMGPMSDDAILERISMVLAASAYNIRNTDVFLKKLASWVGENVPAIDEGFEEPEEWTVVLVLPEDFETGEIHWTAEYGDLHRAGVIHMDPRELRGLEEEAACEDVRGTFEIEVVQELQAISNLDEVLEEQIPEIIRSIRDEPDESNEL